MIKFEYVIRTIGERTEDVCLELIGLQQKPNEKIIIVRESTHAKAIEKTFIASLNSMADWVIVVDADVLFQVDAVSRIRSKLDSCADNVFVVHFAIFDKLYSMKRWAGVHVYRVTMLEELYDKFKKIRKKPNLKIEAATIKEVEKSNKQSLFIKDVVGIHDFEQNYKDIYRKAYLNTIRNPGNIKHARKNWKRKSSDDADYLVMLKAVNDARAENRKLANSVNDFSLAELTEIINNLGLIEKSPLLWEEYVNKCLMISMKSEICFNEKNSAFNDYYESWLPMGELKLLMLRWLPDSFRKYYSRRKSVNAKAAIKNSTKL